MTSNAMRSRNSRVRWRQSANARYEAIARRRREQGNVGPTIASSFVMGSMLPSDWKSNTVVGSNANFKRRGMAEKCQRARRQSISTGLEYRHEVAGMRFCKVHSVRQRIERRAQRSDDRGVLAAHALDLVADDDRIIFADHLSEVSRGREMVMQATVGHQKHFAARDLAVDDAANIKACLAHEIA